MQVELVSDRAGWDAWLAREHGSFLQSSGWGECLERAGKRVERLAVRSAGVTLAAAQVVYVPLPLGWQYAFCPQGPAMKGKGERKKGQGEREGGEVERAEVCRTLTAYLQKKRCIFFRIEPDARPPDSVRIHKTEDINPRATLILDVTPPEIQLRAALHPKTRYNLGLAERAHLTLTAEKDFTSFWTLLKKTGARDHFALHPRRSYEAMLASPHVLQRTVWQGKRPVAVAAWFVWNDTLTYLYGAFDHDARPLMAPHLIQWAGIRLAQERNLARYDWFGIAPRYAGPDAKQTAGHHYNPAHPYAGLTRFKLGFGGEIQEAPGTFDVVTSPGVYALYRLIRGIRRLL